MGLKLTLGIVFPLWVLGANSVEVPIPAQPSAELALARQGSEGVFPLQGIRGGDGNTVAYRIRARLEEASEREALEGEADKATEEVQRLRQKTLRGALEVDWTNRESVGTRELWFHLYLNAFSNNRSVHLTESKGQLRGLDIDEGWGWSRVQALRVRRTGSPETEAVDVFPSFRYVPVDEGEDSDGADRTVFVVDLPFTVLPGETITAEIEWESLLPRVRRRTGSKDDFLLVAQWFPKLGVFEGERGWNCHQFHANTEFFADYGTFDVTLDLPEKYAGKVGGSGVLLDERSLEDGRVEAHFMAPSESDQRKLDQTGKQAQLHDFTWTGDPRFEVFEYTFRFNAWRESYPNEVQRAQELLGADVDLTLRDVDVTILIHPERSGQAARHFRATSAALFFYGLWYGEYPYEHVTVVDPAWGGDAARGMEYPTIFTCGTKLLTTADTYTPESVTLHEAGHQFFYGLVGNNEFEAAWMDEGFNSYTDSEVLWRVYGPQRGTTDFARVPIDGKTVGGDVLLAEVGDGALATVADVARMQLLPLPFDVELTPLRRSGFLDHWRGQPKLSFVQEWTDPRQGDRSGYLRDPGTDPIETRAWEYADRTSYRTNSYQRPAVALRSLGAVIGQGEFLRGMRHYAHEWRYRHPYPEDFYASFQEGADTDCQWFFDELFRGTGTVDWSVEVEQTRRSDSMGYFQRESGEFTVPEAIELQGDAAAEGEAPWVTSVTLRRAGSLRLPLPIRLRWESEGETTLQELTWTREEQGESTWKRLTFEGQAKLVSVELDPEDGYYLDSDRSNDSWFDATDPLVGWRWGERALSQFQRTFFWMAGIGG